jgi:surfeit locus 1 family protein
MLTRLRNAGLIWPTLLALAGLAVLVSLGNWQMRRKAWKEDLIARLEQGAGAAPIPLAEVLAASDPAAFEFRRVKVTGRFDHAQEFHVWAPTAQGPAWSIVTPLDLVAPAAGAGARYPTRLVLVVRGTVPEARKDAAIRAPGQVAGEVEVVGRVRLGGTGWFTARPDPARNQWFAYDLARMRHAVAARAVAGSASGTAEAALGLVAPVLVEAEAAAGGEGAPQPMLNAVNPSNRHLEYALTWYGLALTLIGVYLAFAVSRLRQSTTG